MRGEQLAGPGRPGSHVVEDSARSPSEVDERHERFAALIGAERTAILNSYANSLAALESPVFAEPCVLHQAMTDGSEIVADVVASVQGGGIMSGDRRKMLGETIGATRAERQLSLADLLRATTAIFAVTVNSLVSLVQDDPELLPCFNIAVVALNDSISGRIRETTLAYTGYLLERIDQAHIDERRRIARDLHDQLGEGLSGALRQLELHELTSSDDPPSPKPRAAMAKEALIESMRRLRVMTSDLRQDTVRSLEHALVHYIDTVAANADVRLRVSGDETWAPPAVIEEAFLIIREAIRNALRHGAPQLVLIGVTIAPHELHAWVEDNGDGFEPAAALNTAFTGTGLTSMKERAASVGGRLTIVSASGQGTHLELLVPLSGHRDE